MRFLPTPWRTVGTLSDWERSLTPEGAEALVQAIADLIEETPDSDEDGAAPFAVNLNAFPRPGALGPDE